MEYSGIPSPSFFTDDDEIYQFPLEYNDYDSSTFRVNTSIAGIISFIQKGYRINDVEGWGNVKTPYGSFNCIKVKTTINESDSIIISSVPLPSIPRITIEYKWLTTKEKIPVFEVIGTEFGGQFTVTSIRYRDKFVKTGIESKEQRSNIILKRFTSDVYLVEWTSSNGEEQVKLINMKGQFVDATITGSKGNYTINVSGLESGLYLLWIDTPSFSEIVKIIK